MPFPLHWAIQKALRQFSRYGVRRAVARNMGRLFGDFPLGLEIAGSCNLSCVHCSLRENYQGPKLMPFSLFQSIEKQLGRSSSVRLGGAAEALVHPRFFDILGTLGERNRFVNFHTNAMLLDRAASLKLLEVGNVDYIGISIDGANPETNNSIRKGSDLNVVVRNVAQFQDLKRGQGRRLPHLVLTFVAMRRNYRELPSVVKLAAELGITEVEVNGVEPYSEEMAKEALFRPELRQDAFRIFEEAKRVARVCGVSMPRIPSLIPKSSVCFAMPIITPDGKVHPCYGLAYRRPIFLSVENGKVKEETKTSEEKVFGTVEEESLSVTLRKPELLTFLRRARSGQFPPECDACLNKDGVIC